MWRRWFKQSDQYVGLHWGAGQLSLAVSSPAKGRGQIRQSECLTTGTESFASELAAWVDRHQLAGSACHFVLPSHHYHVIQVAKPAVPDAEVREALRWRVRDLLDYPAEEAVVDWYPLPKDAHRGHQDVQVFAVCARRQGLANWIAQIREANLVPNSIDIPELAIRKVLSLSSQASEAQALLLLAPNAGMLVLTRGKELYLSRVLERELFVGLDGQLRRDAGQSVALEIQRSFDYVEAQLGIASPRNLLLALQLPQAEEQAPILARQVSQDLGVSVVNLLAEPEGLQLGESNWAVSQLVACGAALREVGEQAS